MPVGALGCAAESLVADAGTYRQGPKGLPSRGVLPRPPRPPPNVVSKFTGALYEQETYCMTCVAERETGLACVNQIINTASHKIHELLNHESHLEAMKREHAELQWRRITYSNQSPAPLAMPSTSISREGPEDRRYDLSGLQSHEF